MTSFWLISFRLFYLIWNIKSVMLQFVKIVNIFSKRDMDIPKSLSPLSNKICLCRKYKICIKSSFSYTTTLKMNTNQLKGDWQRYEKNPNAKPLPSVILIFQMWKITLDIWRSHILSYSTKYLFFTFASFLLNVALFPL